MGAVCREDQSDSGLYSLQFTDCGRGYISGNTENKTATKNYNQILKSNRHSFVTRDESNKNQFLT